MKWVIGPYEPLMERRVQIGWQPPSAAISAIDLRRIPDQASLSNGQTSDCLFLAPDDWRVPSECELLANDISLRRFVIADRLKVPVPQRWTPVEFLTDLLTRDSDPIGETAPKPLMPGQFGRMQLVFGTRPTRRRRVLWQDRFRRTAHAAVIDVIKRDYRRHRLRDEYHARQTLDYNRKKLGLNGDEYKTLLPAEYQQDTPIQHATTISDDFVGGTDTSTFGKQLTWERKTVGDWNQHGTDYSRCASAQATAERWCRTTSNLSGDDHTAEMDMFNMNPRSPGGNTQYGLILRAEYTSASQSDDWYCSFCNEPEADHYLYKAVNSILTLIDGPNSHGLTIGTPETSYGTVDGSTLSGGLRGVEQGSATDTSITGNTYVGYYGFTPFAWWDTDRFSAEDLSTQSIVPFVNQYMMG